MEQSRQLQRRGPISNLSVFEGQEAGRGKAAALPSHRLELGWGQAPTRNPDSAFLAQEFLLRGNSRSRNLGRELSPL